MRIRTDGDRAHRTQTIEAVAAFYDCNKTDAMLAAAEDAPAAHRALCALLEDEALDGAAKRAIATAFDERTSWAVEYREAFDVEVNS